MPRRLVATVAALLALSLPPATAPAGEEEKAQPLTFGIVPQQSTGELAKAWAPIIDFLGRKTGEPLRFATAKDIPTFERRLAAGEYDIAYMNPYHYAVFQRSPGYRVFAKEKGVRLKGIVVVRKTDSASDVGQLRGKTVAFPSPSAFAATVLPQAEFRRMGIAVEARYVSSHDSVYLAVARGLFAAGGGIPRTFENMNAEVRDQLRILWTTRDYPPHAIAAHPRLADDRVERLQAAMTRMAADPEGAGLLRAIGFKGLEAARDPEYDDVRRLEIRVPDHALAR